MVRVMRAFTRLHRIFGSLVCNANRILQQGSGSGESAASRAIAGRRAGSRTRAPAPCPRRDVRIWHASCLDAPVRLVHSDYAHDTLDCDASSIDSLHPQLPGAVFAVSYGRCTLDSGSYRKCRAAYLEHAANAHASDRCSPGATQPRTLSTSLAARALV